MLALLPPCILAISQMILSPSEPPSWPCGHGRHLPQLLQFNGRRSIAVQPSRHRRRDSPTGPKTGCRLHGPPRSPDAESRPRGAVFGGAAPLAAHAKWRSAPCERVVRFAPTGPDLFAHACSILLEARMLNCRLRGPLAAMAGPRRDRCGCRSIAVQPSRHRRRDSPTGPKTGCLHGPPRIPDAESRPRGAVFGGAAPLAAHVKKGYSRNSLFPLVFPLASPCYFECAYSAASCLIPQLACSKSDQLLVV